VSWRTDPHDPRFELDRLDNIVLSALGEPVDPDFEEHRRGCEQCRAESAEFARTVRLGRESGEHRERCDTAPAPSVWTAITAELGMTTRAATVRHRPVFSRPRWRTAVLAGAAAVLVATGAAAGYVLGHRDTASRVSVASSARLGAMPDGPTNVSGSASIHTSGKGQQLSVSTRGLPLRQGYYEVWLYNPSSNQMVAVGTLADNGTGSFPVPAGLDPHAYHVVDVSAQDYDGDPAHKQSVLRGQLTQ
jgi:anti-sigma-K factor RskA